VAGLTYCYHSSVHVRQRNFPAVLQPRQREKLAWGTEEEMHGGRVWVVSALGKDSNFRMENTTSAASM
jgi:hypothetical protein